MNENVVMPRELLRRIIRFNFFPAADMDDSWWQSHELSSAMKERLRKTRTAQRALSDFILDSYQLKHESYFDFGSDERRAALLGCRDLKALLYLLGLLIESDTIARVISKEEQHTIKVSLGEADYLYALKNRITMRCVQATNLRPTLADEEIDDAINFKARVYRSGLHGLLALLNDMPRGFIQRILFKLPKSWSIIAAVDRQGDYCVLKERLPHLIKEFKMS